MSSWKRALEFFSRGRPTRRLLAPVSVFLRNLPHGCMREKAEDLLGDFQAVVGGWPSALSWEPTSPPDFRTFSMYPLKKSEAGDRPLPRFLVVGTEG